MKAKAAKINQFFLQQQLPDDIKVAPSVIRSSSHASTADLPLSSTTRIVTALDHVKQLSLEMCRCPHLQEYLPHLLDLELCRSLRNPRGWVMANPVHSLHVASSQFESVSSGTNPTNQPPFLYGEEQQRTEALRTNGVAEYWCPLDGYSSVIHDDTALEKIPVPSLHATHHQQHVARFPSSSTSSPLSKKQKLDPEKVASTSKFATVVTTDYSSNMPIGHPLTTKISSTVDAATNKQTMSSVATDAASKIPTVQTANDREICKVEEKTVDQLKVSAFKDDEIYTESPSFSSGDSKEKRLAISIGGTEGKCGEIEKEHVTESKAATARNHLNTSGDEHTDDDFVKKDEVVGYDKRSTGTKSMASISLGTNAVKKETVADSSVSANVPTNTTDSAKAITTIQETMVKPTPISSPFTLMVSKWEEKADEKNCPFDDVPKAKRQAPIYCHYNDSEASKISTAKSAETSHIMVSKMSEALNDGDPKFGNDAQEEVCVVERSCESSQEEFTRFPSPDAALKETEDRTGAPNDRDPVKEMLDEIPEDSSHVKNKNEQRQEAIAQEGKSSIAPLSSAFYSVEPFAVFPGAATEFSTSGSHTKTGITQARTSIGGAAGLLVPPELEETMSPAKLDPFNERLLLEEDRIWLIRRALSQKRSRKRSESADASQSTTKKKRKRDSDVSRSNLIPGWRASLAKELNVEQEEEWINASHKANETVERWLASYRLNRETYWMEKVRANETRSPRPQTFYLPRNEPGGLACCQLCSTEGEKRSKRRIKKPERQRVALAGDELMRCLECSFIGCSPPSLAPDSRKHILQHLLLSGHKYAVSCGEKAQIFCFGCGDFVYHEVFEQEKIRIDCGNTLPYMGWKDHALLRSFDAFHFLKTQDHGIVWRGLIATYPPMVPREHFFAAQLTMRRHALFEGQAEGCWALSKPHFSNFVATQHAKKEEDKFKIIAPVGMYNHGNTCYMSAILQCLVFCQPLQRFFLKAMGHHYKVCEMYRREIDSKALIAKKLSLSTKSKKSPGTSVEGARTRITPKICLACEMDRLFLSYFGSANGIDVLASVNGASQNLISGPLCDENPRSNTGTSLSPSHGAPLLISDLITSAWKSGGMDHLAGYEQRDAHEFLNSFLELLGRDVVKFRERIHASVTFVGEECSLVAKPNPVETDIISHLFQGSLRSVLLCDKCGVKRVQHEPFVNISLSLLDEVERLQGGKGHRVIDMSVKTCLEHFTHPERLVDLVYCASCGTKTPTKKQHTFAKLPKILCLHLKRFDAARNKKIENFVSFPSHGLNMGRLLSHWCEVSRPETSSSHQESVEPKITYDLFGTVNHKGNMQSGHYFCHVKSDTSWYKCNDQTVSHATEDNVLKADGAYVLFYIRQLQKAFREDMPL